MDPAERHLFEFSPGEMQREEYNHLVRLVEQHLRLNVPSAIVLAPGESPSPGLQASLKCRDRDDSLGQWVLTYDEREALVQDLWGLMLGAEPEFLFHSDGDFPALLRTLDETYFLPAAALRARRESAPPSKRLFHPHTLPRLTVADNAFAQTFAPIVHHTGGGIFTLIEKEPRNRSR
ncbi:hypothetical protein [Cystobacter ferrugineus]|uniref:Uncharacterized protein n=1 Tax=Cystobacter ferrugineus TaxID=83449 RepID=A0A1L9BKI3_9BACT|nr:hypothetical protein [Cystobacter ferrugineus]OJH42706.1 hypothetical protein BON30_05870 [Cystobacter ferrugineus]